MACLVALLRVRHVPTQARVQLTGIRQEELIVLKALELCGLGTCFNNTHSASWDLMLLHIILKLTLRYGRH